MKNFKDIVNSFDIITTVSLHSTESKFAVIGKINGEIIGKVFKYNNYEVAKQTSEKISYFIGI